MTTKEKQEAKKGILSAVLHEDEAGRWGGGNGGEGGLRKDAINVLQAGDKRRKEERRN